MEQNKTLRAFRIQCLKQQIEFNNQIIETLRAGIVADREAEQDVVLAAIQQIRSYEKWVQELKQELKGCYDDT